MTTGGGARRRAAVAVVTGLATLAALGLGTASEALAQSGPGGLTSTVPTPVPPLGPEAGAAARTSTLIAGRAIPPVAAPPAVKRVIRAANRIRARPYVWGGGHAAWAAIGYDCSGAVSYALHGGGLLTSPLVSGSFMRWGARGPGRWITIYANRGHVYAEIAGLRWDTVGDAHGTGPRWHTSPPYPQGFAVRHPIGY